MEVTIRAIEITADNATTLRELFRQLIEIYTAFEKLQEIIKRRIAGGYWTYALGRNRGSL